MKGTDGGIGYIFTSQDCKQMNNNKDTLKHKYL